MNLGTLNIMCVMWSNGRAYRHQRWHGSIGRILIKTMWIQQKTFVIDRYPTAEEVKWILERPHTHMRDFKKHSVSPLFDVFKVKRPVSDIGKHLIAEVASASYSSNNGYDDNEIPALQLRGYQLEGVNWLLWNWRNHRSYILADEMGLWWVSILHFCYFYHKLDY